jgi:large subunit ribosomal protein L30
MKLQDREELSYQKFMKVNINIMEKIKITQVKSTIDRSQRQKDTIIALGIKKLNHSVVKEATPQILGMVRTVNHLIKVEKA